MNTQSMILLGHDALLLPQGRIELKIHDPRDLQTIKDVCQGTHQLVVAMSKANACPPCYPIVTQCRLIDFNQQDPHTFTVVLEGMKRLTIVNAQQLDDQRWVLHTLEALNWQHEPLTDEYRLVSTALAQFYQVNPQLAALYQAVELEDACWVCQRWLEVLPMYNQDKMKLVDQPDFHQTMSFILHLIHSYDEPEISTEPD